MERFFEEHNISYATIHKPEYSAARVFPPNYNPSYKEKDFESLKRKILEEINLD